MKNLKYTIIKICLGFSLFFALSSCGITGPLIMPESANLQYPEHERL